MTQSDWFWIPYELILNLFQAVLYTWFLDRLLNKRTSEKLSFWGCVFLIFAGYSLYSFSDQLTLQVAFSSFWVKLIPAVYVFVFYQDPWWIKLMWCIMLATIPATIISLCYYICAIFVGGSFDLLLARGWARIGFTVFGNLLLGSVLATIVRFFTSLKNNNYTTPGSVVLLIVIDIASYCMTRLMFWLYPDGYLSSTLFVGICSLSLVVCIVSLFLYRSLCSYAAKAVELSYMEGQKAAVDNRLEEISKMYSMMQFLNHDIRKHMQVTEDMLSRHEVEESREYLAEVSANLDNLFSTGCLPLDSALTVRKKILEDHQIGFLYELCDLQRLPLSSTDFCTIIMNLLDNATEASVRYFNETFEHFVKLTIRHHRDMFFIECINPCPSRPLQKDHSYFVSTKEGRGHGLGIKVIESIVDSIEGTCSFEQKGSYFKASISLPYYGTDEKKPGGEYESN